MEPKSIPKRVKIEGDFQERKNTLQDRLGEVLEPSWSDLGPSWPNLRPSWDDLESAGGAKSWFSRRFFMFFVLKIQFLA